MTLYHFSNAYYETLIPQYGKNRNNSEDSRVAEKHCIWFTNKTSFVGTGTYSHCYLVEVEENDPDLIEDQTVVELMSGINKDERWYAYLKEVKPNEIHEKKSGHFERIK